ncbi:MAG: hypothetical protein K1X78_01330 [Verrucomicrobiaceae bacterium]|nr:hypothetical protein [Verrucomicrobiaceae bacterium]
MARARTSKTTAGKRGAKRAAKKRAAKSKVRQAGTPDVANKATARAAGPSYVRIEAQGAGGKPPRVYPMRPLKGDRIEKEALRWRHLAARRQQWLDSKDDDEETGEEGSKLLADLGIDRAAQRVISAAEAVQVCIPWTDDESEFWAERILPWEFLLVRALRHVSSFSRSPVVVRQLFDVQPQGSVPEGAQVPDSAIGVVVCPPGTGWQTMRETYQRERAMVKAHLGQPEMESIDDPDRDRLGAEIARRCKGGKGVAVHLLSVITLREREKPPRDTRPHLFLPDKAHQWCELEDAAKSITSGDKFAPALVCMSFCDSGPRLAALTVAHGAHAALGFQDMVTDDVCESFFGIFYHEWRKDNEWNLLAAFKESIRQMAHDLQGAGVILWSRHSLFEARKPAEEAAPAARKSRAPKSTTAAPSPQPVSGALAPPASVALEAVTSAQIGAQATPPPSVAAPSVALAPGAFVVTAEVNDKLNYSILHNQHYKLRDETGIDPATSLPLRLFSKFNVKRMIPLADGAKLVADVEVTLHAGTEDCAWRQLVELNSPSEEIAPLIRVPLTSALVRSLRESMRTTVTSRVSILGSPWHIQTHAVTLLAIDEWRDDGVCHVWLPSFVLPRDPAVGELVSLARRSLCIAADDFNAGFDGYQRGERRWVDMQVQALWATIIDQWDLAYINPPPSFSDRSQRLRFPSTIRKDRAGTCIDLALLLAACLEYIGIETFVVLGPGHAYVGYGREPRAKRDLFSAIEGTETAMQGTTRDAMSRATRAKRILAPWVYDKDHHPAIVRALDEDETIGAIEATMLTQRKSFAEARGAGDRRMRMRLEFDCLIDVYHARQPGFDVTPLPLSFTNGIGGEEPPSSAATS